MNFWYVLSGVIAVILLLPYIRCFFKRMRCKAKLEKLCKTKGYQLHKTHHFWFLGCKYSKKCDIYIETANEIFALKLFGMPKKLSVLVLKENGEYFIRKFIAIFSYGSPSRSPIDGRPKPLPAYNFRYNYRDEWEIKTPRRILLINPISFEIRRKSSNGNETVIGAGEIANGMQITSLHHLLEDLERAL